MNKSLFQNGINWLVANGMNEDKAFHTVKQAEKELTSLPIASNFEDIFYIHLRLAKEVEDYKEKNKLQTPKQLWEKKHNRKAIVRTSLDSIVGNVKTFSITYE